MIYDLIISEKLGPYHNYILDFNRFEVPEGHIKKDLLDKINEGLKKTIIVPKYNIPNLSEIMALGDALDNILFNKSEELSEQSLNESYDIIEALAFFNIEVYCMLRNDIEDPNMTDIPYRSYLIDKRGEFHRVAPALGIGIASKFDSTIPDVVMEFLGTKLSMASRVESILRFSNEIEKYRALKEMNSGYEYNVTKLLDLIEGRGFEIKIFTGDLT